jgi:DNA-binding NtrC family response regulator
MSRLLIIDDEPAIGWSLRELFVEEGHAVELSASVEEGLETCSRFMPDAMLLDVRLPGRDGLSALSDFKRIVPGAPVVVMTAFGDLNTAVRAVTAGAFDYLVKPFTLESVSQVMGRALAEQALALAGQSRGLATQGRAAVPSQAEGGRQDLQLLGSSAAMQEVFKQISLVAPTELPVLITGETGTGKDVVARAIHAHSPRRAGPLVATSLAALAPSVIESELFGHVRAAFTGASVDRAGLFELATGGTLFLDEIGEVPLDVQVKLLRTLETREVVRMGSATPRPVNVRVIAATHRDLAQAIETGAFREDLYHRLHVFPIHVPPLSARGDDVEILARHFLDRFTAHRRRASLAPEFLAAIRGRPWPGNVRELKHAIEYAAVVARGGMLQPEHLPAQPAAAAARQLARGPGMDDQRLVAAVRAWVDAALTHDGEAGGPLHSTLIDLVETTLVERVVDAAGGNRTAAAKLLGLDRATLRSKLSR